MLNFQAERQLIQLGIEAKSLEAKVTELKNEAEKYYNQRLTLIEKCVRLSEKRHRNAFLKQKIAQLRQTIFQGDRSNKELLSFLSLRRTALNQVSKKFDQEKSWLRDNQDLFEQNRASTDSILNSISISVHEAIEAIYFVYPITKVDDTHYTIRHIYFPSPDILYQQRHAEGIATALGWICHIVLLLSHLLSLPCRFRIYFSESRSSISDPSTDTIYPLYEKGQPLSMFEFGVYLLNKSIVELLETQGLVAQQLQMTLANLKLFMDSFRFDPASLANPTRSHFSSSSISLSPSSPQPSFCASELSSEPSISPTQYSKRGFSTSLIDDFTAKNGQLVKRSSVQFQKITNPFN